MEDLWHAISNIFTFYFINASVCPQIWRFLHRFILFLLIDNSSIFIFHSRNFHSSGPSFSIFFSFLIPWYYLYRLTNNADKQMKATVLAESSILYFIFSPGSLCYGDYNRHESGRCRTLPSFLIFYIMKLWEVQVIIWARGNNHKIYINFYQNERTGQKEITIKTKQRKWNWIEHTLRKHTELIERKALDWSYQGSRGRERPRPAWEN